MTAYQYTSYVGCMTVKFRCGQNGLQRIRSIFLICNCLSNECHQMAWRESKGAPWICLPVCYRAHWEIQLFTFIFTCTTNVKSSVNLNLLTRCAKEEHPKSKWKGPKQTFFFFTRTKKNFAIHKSRFSQRSEFSWVNLNSIHLSILCRLFFFRVEGGLEPIPAVLWRETGYTLERSPVCRRANKFKI